MLSHCHADPTRMLALKDGTYTEHACSSDTPTIYKLTTVAFAGRTDVCSDVVIADNPTYGRVLFLEGELQSAETDQVVYHEMLVHPVMAATTIIPDRKVLVVGGGEGATVQEVLRWTDVSTVVWIDIDEGLVNLCRRHLDWTENDVYNNPKVQFLAEDIRTALPRYDKFDVIILDLPDPDSEEVAKDGLYGSSFWKLLHEHVSEGGAIATHVGPVAPGADVERHRTGLHIIQEYAGTGYPYHMLIPSFQSEWGFWMSIPPVKSDQFPTECSVIDEETITTAFTWSRYWFSSAVGIVRPL
jgi:spermidine synthase